MFKGRSPLDRLKPASVIDTARQLELQVFWQEHKLAGRCILALFKVLFEVQVVCEGAKSPHSW